MQLNQDKAVVVFSGGQDSTTCLFWALQNFKEVMTLSFDYGQRHQQELAHAEAIAKELGVSFHIMPMHSINELSPNALTKKISPLLSVMMVCLTHLCQGAIIFSFRLQRYMRMR